MVLLTSWCLEPPGGRVPEQAHVVDLVPFKPHKCLYFILLFWNYYAAFWKGKLLGGKSKSTQVFVCFFILPQTL